MTAKVIILDAEIEKAIAKKGEDRIDGIEYCAGFHDFENMGVSVVCGYDYATERYRVFARENREDLARFIEDADTVITYNGDGFDRPLLRAALQVEWAEKKNFDLLDQLRQATGEEKPKGLSLANMAKANGIPDKSGAGALAPVRWQRGDRAGVIDYCLADVWITKQLIDRLHDNGLLRDPRIEGGHLSPALIDSLM